MPAAGGGRAEVGPRGGPLRQRESRRLPGGTARPAAPAAAARPAALALVTLLSFASRFHRLPEPPHVWYGPGRGLCPSGGALPRGWRAWPQPLLVPGRPPPPGRRPANGRLSAPRPAPRAGARPSPQPSPRSQAPARPCRARLGRDPRLFRRALGWDPGSESQEESLCPPASPLPAPAPLSLLLSGRVAERGPSLGEAVWGIWGLQAVFFNISKPQLESEGQTRGFGVLISHSLRDPA